MYLSNILLLYPSTPHPFPSPHVRPKGRPLAAWRDAKGTTWPQRIQSFPLLLARLSHVMSVHFPFLHPSPPLAYGSFRLGMGMVMSEPRREESRWWVEGSDERRGTWVGETEGNGGYREVTHGHTTQLLSSEDPFHLSAHSCRLFTSPSHTIRPA